jgi:hemerythrin superfamily protein
VSSPPDHVGGAHERARTEQRGNTEARSEPDERGYPHADTLARREEHTVNVDVVDLITQDHREVERLFDELETHPDKRPLLTPVLGAVLTAHSRAEEAEVYPVAKDEAGEVEEIEHSREEHAEAEQLPARLSEADPTSPAYDEVPTKLVDAVTHHVLEEETKVLPGMRQRLSEERRAELGRAFATSRGEHLGDRPGQGTRDELLVQARNAGLSGAASMSKERLNKELHKLPS